MLIDYAIFYTTNCPSIPSIPSSLFFLLPHMRNVSHTLDIDYFSPAVVV